MAIGDNFDTTPPGFRNQTTNRASGHGIISQHPGHYSDDNKGHPCNVGCGCKTACHEGSESDPDARCQLPPELTIYVTTASNRPDARRQISAGNPAAVTKVHLVYSNGAWRGRKCCEFDSNGNELCDPCDVTTDQFGNKTDCSYGGQEGATRNRSGSTGPPGGTRRPNPDAPRQADSEFGRCLQDGDIPDPLQFCASYTDANFNNLYSQVGFERCSGGFCVDGGGSVNNDNEKTCCDNGFTWKYQRCLSGIGGSPVGGSCESDDDSGLALDGSTCASKSECDCKFYAEGCGWTELYNEFDCLAKFRSDGYTWSHNWIDDPSGNPQECCSQELISDRSPAHQPNISSGQQGVNKARGQITCLTPYKEYILMPGGVPNFMGCMGVDNPTPDIRKELGEFAGSRGVFTLIIRDCDYNKNCLDNESNQNASKIGKETILYIPIDQMINCSDFRLPYDEKTGALGNPVGWLPNDVDACASPDWNGDGIADANGSGCSQYIYAENTVRSESYRRVHPPGDYNLHKLNIQAQPFKATESRQKTVKTLKQAEADKGAHQACICASPIDCPHPPNGDSCEMDIDHGIGYWFENDYIGGSSLSGPCVTARNQIRHILAGSHLWEDVWSCRDTCGRLTGFIHHRNAGLVPIIYNSSLVGTATDPVTGAPLYTGRLDYWGDTGLAPFNMYAPYQPENSFPPISYVLDNCYGSHRGGRSGVVEFASNTSPIVIKSTNHGLRDMDFISVKGVMGNFSANTLKKWEWNETGWQEKKGQKCAETPEECDKTFHPAAYCNTAPFDTTVGGDPARRLPLWVIEVVDKDHFILKDCNGFDSDGTIDFGDQCETKYTCVDYLSSLIDQCPCNTLDSVPDVVPSPPVDLLVNEATCESYGYCQIINTPPGSNTMTTKADCITLAQHWAGYDSPGSNIPLQPPHPGSCTDGCTGSIISATDQADCLAQSSQSCPPNVWQTPIYHSCVDQSQGFPNFDTCWLPHEWAPARAANPYDDKVGNWPACPFTGEWTLCDQTEGTYDMAGAPIPNGQHTTCKINEIGQPRFGADEYRLGYDHTPKMREDLANDYYVQIDQTEVCPVCCDHYMPKELLATVSSLSTSVLNGHYCLTDCNGNPLPEVSTGFMVHPGGDTPFVCEPEPNGTYPLGCVPGKYGGSHCCDCIHWPPNATGPDTIAGCFDCSLSYRFSDDWALASDSPCCGCECEPGDSKKLLCEKDYPSLEEFFACNGCCGDHGSESACGGAGCEWANGACGMKEGCGGTCGNLSCEPSGDGQCEGMFGSCSEVGLVGSDCLQSDATCAFCTNAPGCSWDTVPGGPGGMYQCSGDLDNSLCTGDPNSGTPGLDSAACTANPYCEFKLFAGSCVCVPCAGFPNDRDLGCEAEFICAPGGNLGGCKDQPPPGLCDGGPGYDNPGGEGCGPPGMPGSIGDCVMPDRGVRDGCPGLNIPSFGLKYNGSMWVSDWISMGEVGHLQCELTDFPGFCAGKCCVKGGKQIIPANGAPCESVGGTLTDACGSIPVPGADCGACAEWQQDGCLNCGASTSGQDNHYIRLELYCGDMEAYSLGAGPKRGGLMSDESYERPSMQLRAWITTCMYPSCRPGNSLCPEGGGCSADCSTEQKGSVPLVTPAHIPGMNCGPRSPCIGCCNFAEPPCIVYGSGREDCYPQTTGCGVPCYGACADEDCFNGMCGELAMVECGGQIGQPGITPTKTKEPEVFHVSHVRYTGNATSGPIPGQLFVRPVKPAPYPGTGPVGCEWPIGTTVSLGEASRRVAETGGGRGGPRAKSSTDVLALPPQYPLGTVLTDEITPDEYPNSLDSYSKLMVIDVADVRAFTTHSGAQNRHLWRNSNNEVFPYGNLPWPVTHQWQGDPASLNNLGRIGVQATSVGDYDARNFIDNVQNIYGGNGQFSHILVTTKSPHDLITGEKIVLDGLECFKSECNCKEGLNPIHFINLAGNPYGSDVVVITGDASNHPQPHGLTTGDMVFIEGVQGCTTCNGSFTITISGLNAFKLDGTSGDAAYTPSIGDTWTKVCHLGGQPILDDDGNPAEKISGVDRLGCEARGGAWADTDVKIKTCPRICETQGWWDEDPCDPSVCQFSTRHCRPPSGSSEGPVCYGCGSPLTTEDIEIGVSQLEKDWDDINGPYVIKFVSSTQFTLHYEKHLDFETMSSKIFGYDPTTNVPNPVPPTPPVTPTGPDPALNTRDDAAEWNDSVEATEWGHEVMVGPAVGPFTGKALDWIGTELGGGAVWTRHAGGFFVVLNDFKYVDKPGTACRQGNSTKPTVLNFDLLFENACCNNRQPPHNMDCQSRCYQGGGPVVIDWVDHMQDRGKAPIGVVITEVP